MRERESRGLHLLFQPLDQNTGPVDRPTPTVDPKPLDMGVETV